MGLNQLGDIIRSLLDTGEGKNIILLSLWDFLRARRNKEYRSYVLSAALVIPISKSLVSGVRFVLDKPVPRYMPFDFVVRLLSSLEERELSLYLLGGKLRTLQKAEKNIRQTFPYLRVVGRYKGSFKKSQEQTILQAIRKASPSLLLVGQGVTGGEQWIAKHDAQLPGGLRLWCSDLFEIFAEQRKHPSRYSFDHGLEWMGYCLQKPIRVFKVFPYLYYKFLLLVYRLFPPKSSSQRV
ncbi:MAG: WecB/TagA/CpsF family glycosyltransferase [Spirochaetaceae bacterium]|jgi:N-acetylglucosaminyldiphosphoundecaprenol N-acetyl-beta-D-mannosaminyltransferase|nr:WecB/TagA/CpsF family glycosyltransferase [Spirochaetaceae bacterium]